MVRQLQRIAPEWQPAHGACPQCIFQAVQRAQAASSRESLQQQLRLPFPAYLPDHVGILPTPLRVSINPKYTGQGVTLAFLDSGFYPHPDLTRPTNRIVAYCDATAHLPEERPSFGKIQETSWHGLMTSCLAAAHDPMPLSPQRTVTFHYHDKDARQVAIVGSFNNWLPYGYEMQEVAPGAWRLTVPAFARGLHAYNKFLLDRTRWAADPENPARVEDGQGAFYSVIEVT